MPNSYVITHAPYPPSLAILAIILTRLWEVDAMSEKANFPCCNPSSSPFHLRLPTNTDHTGSDQLLDLGPHARVLHVFLESSGLRLGLLEDRLHYGVLHEAHNLYISQ